MKISRQKTPSPLTAERKNTPSSPNIPLSDSVQSKSGKAGKATGGDTFQKAQGSNVFGQQMGVGRAKGFGSHALKPNTMAVLVMTETMNIMTSEAKTTRAGLAEAFTAKVAAKASSKDQVTNHQAKERNQAWVNVGVAFAETVGSLVKGAADGASTMTSRAQTLAGGMSQSLSEVSSQLAKGDTAGAMATWGESLKTSLSQGPLNMDINALIQDVLRESYMQNTEDLKHFAEKVKHNNEQKKELRGYLQEVRASRSNVSEISGEPPSPSLPSGGSITQGQLENPMAQLGEQLQSLGDDAQLANIDLQNVLQKQQQTLQTMSNVSKLLHDTAKAVIRKMGD